MTSDSSNSESPKQSSLESTNSSSTVQQTDSSDILQSIAYQPYFARNDEPIWHIVLSSGTQTGPISENEIKFLIASAQLSPHTMGWRAGLGAWTYLYSLPEIHPHFLTLMPSATRDETLGKQWFYLDGKGEKQGQCDLQEMQTLVSSKQIGPTSRVWCLGDAPNAWLPMSEVPALETLFPQSTSSESKSTHQGGVGGGMKRLTPSISAQPSLSTPQLSENNMNNANRKADDESSFDPQHGVRLRNAQELKRRKKEFSQIHKGRSSSIYLTGLPLDITEVELHDFAKKVGLIRLNDDGLPRIKIYLDSDGKPKGDGLVTFLQVESVDLAVTLLDEAEVRPGYKVSVTEASFDSVKSSDDSARTRPTTTNKANAAMYLQAQKQALSWDDGHDTAKKGLKVVLILHAYTLEGIQDFVTRNKIKSDNLFQSDVDIAYQALEEAVTSKVEYLCGYNIISKVKAFQNNPLGPVLVRLRSPGAAQIVIENLQSESFSDFCSEVEETLQVDYFSPGLARKITEAGAQQDNEEKRREDFGDWLEKNS